MIPLDDLVRFPAVFLATVFTFAVGLNDGFGQSLMSDVPRAPIKAFTEPYRSIDLAASEMGTLSSIEVAEGDQVKAEQILGRLSEEVLAASKAMIQTSIEAQGKLNAALAELKIQEETLTKVEGLFQRKHASQVELDRAKGQAEVSRARVEAVRDEMRVKQFELQRVVAQIEQRRLRSPIDGIVTQVFKDVGEFVSSADPVVFRIVQLDPLLVVFSLPEQHASKLEPNQDIMIVIGDRKKKAPAIVEFVSPTAEAQSGTYRVRLRVPNERNQWKSGSPCFFQPALIGRPVPGKKKFVRENLSPQSSRAIAN